MVCRFLFWILLAVFFLNHSILSDPSKVQKGRTMEIATFAGGCFWCMEPPYDKLPGVLQVTVGYTGGHKPNPSYEEVCSGKTGHTEAVQIQYDPKLISYEKLLEVFWENINPTQANGQFYDLGSQYRTAIFYHNEMQKKLALESKRKLQDSGKFSDPIATDIQEASTFYPAEEYHQKYYKKNPEHYKRYSIGSGRVEYKKRVWGKE